MISQSEAQRTAGRRGTAFIRYTAIGAGVALALSACAPGGGSDEATGGPVELTFAAYQWLEPGLGEPTWELVQECAEEQPDLTLKQQAIPYDQYSAAILQQLSGGGGAQLMQLRVNQFAAAAEAGLLQPMDDVFDEASIPNLVGANDVGVIDGKRLGILQGLTNFGLFYNTTLLEEAGIEPPTTFEELLSAAKELTDPATGQYGLAFREGMSMLDGWQSDLSYFVYGFGASWVDDKGIPTFDTPEMKKAVEAYLEVYNSGVMPIGTDAPTFRSMFADGKVAMLLQNQNIPSQIVGTNPAMQDQMKAIVPPFPTGKQPMIPALWSIAADASADEAAAAGKLLECLYTPEMQNRMTVISRGGTPGTDVFADPAPEVTSMLEETPWLGVVEANAGDNSISIIPEGAEDIMIEYSTVFFQELSKVQVGEESLEDGLARAQEAGLEVAKENGKE